MENYNIGMLGKNKALFDGNILRIYVYLYRDLKVGNTVL